ncbi:MAG TPA: IS4 family transposase [Flavitalea sp.]|nr:IS4 family transposase [Flavitalea sp.]
MTPNRSLAISNAFRYHSDENILGVLQQEFPHWVLSKHDKADTGSRNRVFTAGNTLLTMILSATQQDKTLKNSVDLYYKTHQDHKRQVLEELHDQAQQQKLLDQQSAAPLKAGRPKAYKVHLPKSLDKDISLNTAAYSKARDRVSLELIQDVFKASCMEHVQNNYSHWHGHKVMITDGTYLQLQDTAENQVGYAVKSKGEQTAGYPQGLLQVLIDRGSGQVVDFKLSDRHTSELRLFYDMLDHIEPGTVVLADALYDCYEIIAKCIRKNIKIVFPVKKPRNYEVIKTLAPGDELIRIKQPKEASPWLDQREPATTLTIRRIACKSPDGIEYVLATTVLENNIDKYDIQQLYLTRWDVEIGIREIKTIMDVNILRSKTPEMALKELTVSLTAYNLIRKIIYASIKDLPFSPKGDLIEEFYSFNQDVLVDKKGRVYNRWSTGRPRTQTTDQ